MPHSPRAALPVVVLALAAACIAVRPASAQGSIRGVVFDSLGRQAPVADAMVELVGTARRVRTDSRGRYEIEKVPAGRHQVRHHDYWLDSLSLGPLTAFVDVRDGRESRADLRSPGRNAYTQAVCGTTFDQSAGVLRGEVRAPNGVAVAGVMVGGVWSQAVVSRQGLSGELLGAVDTTDAHGMFTLCGVPRGVAFTLRAGNDSVTRSDLLTVSIGDAFVSRRDVVIGDGSARARVRGRVVTARGTPMANAVIALAGDADVGARTNERGEFVLDGLPQRSSELIVRTVGYTPHVVIVDLTGGETDLSDVTLLPVPYRLDTVRVNAARTVRELEFLQRRRSGLGAFLDSAELARIPVLSANVLQTFGNGIRSNGANPPRMIIHHSSAMIPCAPTFWVDGVRYGAVVDGFEEQALLRTAKRVEIHRAPATPPEYYDMCAVVLIWTS